MTVFAPSNVFALWAFALDALVVILEDIGYAFRKIGL